jgi:hypothetical protein
MHDTRKKDHHDHATSRHSGARDRRQQRHRRGDRTRPRRGGRGLAAEGAAVVVPAATSAPSRIIRWTGLNRPNAPPPDCGPASSIGSPISTTRPALTRLAALRTSAGVTWLSVPPS